MPTTNNFPGSPNWPVACLAGVLLATFTSCSRPAPQPEFKIVPAGQESSGFLSTYDNLKPNPRFENTRSWVAAFPAKNLHQYVAVIVEPPSVYVSSDVLEKTIPNRGVASLKEYFQSAITDAVADAFPVVQSSGPLVLRLRSAIVGVDVGRQDQADQKDPNRLERVLNIGKVGVEMELVDSETGEQVAAVVDRQNLGESAAVGSANFTREQKFRAATDAFDGWAARLREFLDSAHEVSKEDAARAEATNFPYAK